MFSKVVDLWKATLVQLQSQMITDLKVQHLEIQILDVLIRADLDITKAPRTKTTMTVISSTEDSAPSLEMMIIDLETSADMTKVRVVRSTSICEIVRVLDARITVCFQTPVVEVVEELEVVEVVQDNNAVTIMVCIIVNSGRVMTLLLINLKLFFFGPCYP
jgi:hypothetical protein